MYLFFDVETTGLPTRRGASYRETSVWPRIVSIAWAFYNDEGEVQSETEYVIRPDGFRIPAAATAIHGISHAEALENGSDLEEVIDELLSEVEYYEPQLLIAHNMDYDRNVILCEMVRAGSEMTLVALPAFCTMLSSVDICRIPAGKRYKWPTLQELHEHVFGEEFEDAHSASADVEACARCFFQLVEEGHFEIATLPGASSDEEDEEDEDQEDYGDELELIERILTWAEGQPSFDTSFVESMQERIENGRGLTPNQSAALENIVDSWNID